MSEIDPTVLPDYPGVWSTSERLGFRQRWMSQAFGKRESILGIFAFRVLDDEWETSEDGEVLRTILKAEVF